MTAIAVRDRPLLMSGPMVRAILDGRKTMTRRVVIPQPPKGVSYMPVSPWDREVPADCRVYPGTWAFGGNVGCGWMELPMREAYGRPGDRLWVRETAWYDEAFGGRVFYDDGMMRKRLGGGVVAANGRASSESQKRKPSIFMPRWASRLTLEITEVRVERLGEISDEDIRAEGFDDWKGTIPAEESPFAALWDSLNAKRGYAWDVNPWVWALTFKGVTP